MTHQKTILIIDDEISILNSLTSFFEDEDYVVFTAEDGERGLDIFFNQDIDIILTDLRMPKKAGIEVMKTIHKDKPGTPMIVVSGAGKKEDIINALKLFKNKYEIPKKEIPMPIYVYLVKENILFLNPIEGTLKPQSYLVWNAIKRLLNGH